MNDHISDVNWVWRFHLKHNMWEGRELFTTLERTHENKAKYNTLGKVKSMLENLKETQAEFKEYTVRIFWGSDMCAYLEDPRGAPQLIAEVTTSGVDWDPQSLLL